MSPTRSTDPTRRAAIGAALATVALPAVAVAGILAEPDPIFAAIEAHRAAFAAFEATVTAQSRLEQTTPRPRTYQAEDLTDADTPEWRAAVIANDTAGDAEQAAAWALVDTEPTTVAGAAALLRYAYDFSARGDEWPDDAGEGTKFTERWDSELHKSLATSLAKIAAGGAVS